MLAKGAEFCGSCAEWKTKSDFRRGADRCKVCQLIACAGCGEDKARAEYAPADVSNFFYHHQNVLCQACRQRGSDVKKAPYKPYSVAFCAEKQLCRKCGVHQNLVAFRRSQVVRNGVCRGCELMPCGACAVMLPQDSFTPKDVACNFSGTRIVVCLECKARDQWLRQQWRGRKGNLSDVAAVAS